MHVVATIDLVPGAKGAFLEELRAVTGTVRAEPGCIEYGAAEDAPTGIGRQAPLRPDTVVILEKWASLANLEAHLASAHMLAYRERVKGHVRSTRLEVLRPL